MSLQVNDFVLSLLHHVHFANGGTHSPSARHRHSSRAALLTPCHGLAGDLTNLFIGHASWDTFSSMTEIYKNYKFAICTILEVKAQSLSMSSFPGELFSDGDIYLMSSKLVVVSTTLHIYNNTIYKDINPQAVVCTSPTLPHQTTYACLHMASGTWNHCSMLCTVTDVLSIGYAASTMLLSS